MERAATPAGSTPVAGAAEEAVVAETIAAQWSCDACKADNEADDHVCTSCRAGRRFEGVLKSVGSDYGFIDCVDTQRRFHRDVWVSRPVLDAAFQKGIATSGVRVDFQISLNHDGHPNAKAMRLLKSDDDASEDLTFHGSIKYISEEKGYGFIECAEALELYGGDVHADLQALHLCSLGQQVSLQVRLGQIGGRPQAVNVTPEGPPPVLPTAASFAGEASRLLRSSWEQGEAPRETLSWLAPARDRRVLLLGDGDLTFAAACAELHKECCLDATVYLEASQWHERFEEPNDGQRITALQERSHRVRFGVDATTESCAGCSAVYFNFPNVSVTEATVTPSEAQSKQEALTPSGALASAFLENARTSADPGTLLVLGLWGRCDGGADPRLYGLDSHALVAARIASSQEADGNALEDALEVGFEREGVRGDYSFYGQYEELGYSFRTNWESGFAHKEWHLKACFVLRVVAK